MSIDSPEFKLFLRKRFDLTRSHAELLLHLADGKCLCDAGKAMGITECSVRTYCRNLLSELNVHCQHQMVVLVYKTYLEFYQRRLGLFLPQ
jgi:DNA-binding NarL/FixJ family response regulator